MSAAPQEPEAPVRRWVSGLLSLTGLAPSATGDVPVVPMQSPVQLALMAAWRQRTEQTAVDEASTLRSADATNTSLTLASQDSTGGARMMLAAAANSAPTAVADSVTVVEDTVRTFSAKDLVRNDTDPERTTMAVHSVSGATNGTVVLNANGTVTFTPTANYSGPASFSYRVKDAAGLVSANSATVSVTVTPVNDAPTAMPDSVAVAEDTARTFTAAELVGNDTDPEGGVLSVHSVSGATNGTVVLNANGTVTFTPTANYSGPASFSYRVKDATELAQRQFRHGERDGDAGQ